ncbi:Serine/threonine-protein kinase PknK [Nocardioides aquaticus]|uniref:non-specific serine/threonine protein kinase n=1 Tax=Nocardioides aquaticus TaxID=160826 RepID=A0ABX8EIC9_9ACTN|nr:serine/threonine-protein kinase [Nocardioides aquaticus]QVT80274.1 Serine/threonine-protein kinase PknK [Nocardioides aquaticus]
MTGRDDRWRFREGDRITAELTAVRLLGGGSAYEAYLAFDEITYGPVVVKVVRPHQVADPHSLRGLRREVDTLATVNHPAVMRGLRHELAGERPHVVLEHLDGPRLSSLVRRHGPLQEAQYLPLAVEMASALHYFGHVDVVHLDLKPSNIIMGAPARLIDLSVARTTAAAAALTGRIGTDAYMSPEQCEPGSRGTPGPASDVWGLGATLFEAVAGHRAFADPRPSAGEPEEQYPQLVDRPAPLPDRTPPAVVSIIHAALEQRPADRPEPHEVSAALEPVLAAQPPVRLTFSVRG